MAVFWFFLNAKIKAWKITHITSVNHAERSMALPSAVYLRGITVYVNIVETAESRLRKPGTLAILSFQRR